MLRKREPLCMCGRVQHSEGDYADCLRYKRSWAERVILEPSILHAFLLFTPIPWILVRRQLGYSRPSRWVLKLVILSTAGANVALIYAAIYLLSRI